MPTLPDYYQILEVKPNASLAEIRSSYHRRALKWHPDHAREAAAVEKFHLLKEAYETLRSPERRRAYDETRSFRVHVEKAQPKSAKAGRAALSWVDEFFIQAGGIEAEGPGKGSLRKFSVTDYEAIWSTITGRLSGHGEVRQSIRQFELLAHYIRGHSEQGLPANWRERLDEKKVFLDELETVRKGTAIQWHRTPHSLEDLLRRQRYPEARSLLIWRSSHAMTELLAEAGLFKSIRSAGAPAKELAMVDRLEAIAAGETPERRLGHGYIACRQCGAWALDWGVGAPHCATCGARRFALRPRDERDDWLAALLGRNVPAFWRQYDRYRASVVQGLERWVWAPLFLMLFGVAILPAAWASWNGLPLLAVLLFAEGWWCGAWRVADIVPGDTDIIFPDEWDVARTVAGVMVWIVLFGLALIALSLSIQGRWRSATLVTVELVLVFFGPEIRAYLARQAESSSRRM